MKRAHTLWICLLASFLVASGVLAADAPSTDTAVTAPSTALETETNFEPAVETAVAGLPESVVVELSRIPVPSLRVCPAYCTGNNLTYIGVGDCFLNGYLAACKIFRNNSTGSRCASVCYHY